ncbi:MAG: hypothetical protein RL238_3135 [Actinomycetota bacterium]
MIADLPPGHEFRAMTPDDVAQLVEWAAAESWNPGRHDVPVAWSVDPGAFIALRRDGEMIGGGSVFSYGGAFGFMGLFIMRPDCRGHGLGGLLWQHRLQRMRARLRPDAAVGMDGVFRMAPFYARGGFVLAYRDLRFDGVAPAATDEGLLPVAAVGFDALDAFDRRHVAAPRTEFLRAWTAPADVHTAVMVDDDEVVGMAVLRPCRDGYRFGPVHADRPDVAERLITGLMSRVAGAPVQIDVPEPNGPGLDIVARLGMTESFGCARMYHGPDPLLPVERIYGVTSFEFG